MLDRWQKVTGHYITEAYGLTESSPGASCVPLDIPWNGSIGLPIPSTEMSIRDDDFNEIPAWTGKGEVERAAARLTRPFVVEGVVIAGFQRGRTIDVPTANMSLAAYARPRFGVYAVDVDIGDGVIRRGVANCGVKPTVEGAHAPLLETFIFDYQGDLYGRTIEVGFRKFIRDEKKFDSFDALRAQIAEDIASARSI